MAGVFAVVGVSLTCARNPVTGKRELDLLGRQQAEAMGAEGDRQIVAQFGIVGEPRLATYTEELGRRLVAVSHVPAEGFQFRVLDDPVVNAFALPGGHVYLTRGILAYLDSEAAMAGVLGHEIGHVAARHASQRYTQSAVAGLGIGLGAVLSDTVRQYAGEIGAGLQLLFLKYSRDDEREADDLGVKYALATGFDPGAMAAFFGKLAKLQGGRSVLPAWAATHPDPGERQATIEKKAGQLVASPQSTEPLTLGRRSFLAAIDGMKFGPDPREGFVDGQTFKHPGLAFQFPFPAGWKVENSRQQVVVVAPEGQAAVIFTQAGQQGPAGLAAQQGTREVSRTPMTVNGFEAVRVQWIATNEGGEQVPVESTYINGVGPRRIGVVFHALAAPATAGGALPEMRRCADGFAPLTNSEDLAVKAARLKIVTIERPGRLRDVLSRYPIPRHAGVDPDGWALLNGMALDDEVPAGSPVKVLVDGS
jgi:predicted Zn-dependent protease